MLVGFTTPAQVEMNLTCLGEPLTAEDLTFVRATMQALGQALDAASGVFLDDVTAGLAGAIPRRSSPSPLLARRRSGTQPRGSCAL